VESMSTSTNSKYWSMDHKDSTAPSAYDTKNLSAAGTSTEYENSSLPSNAPPGALSRWVGGEGESVELRRGSWWLWTPDACVRKVLQVPKHPFVGAVWWAWGRRVGAGRRQRRRR
jgi:hypothetical protein